MTEVDTQSQKDHRSPGEHLKGSTEELQPVLASSEAQHKRLYENVHSVVNKLELQRCARLQAYDLMGITEIWWCPGFGQDRVNFHQNPGRGTARWADPTPTWPEPDIPYHMPSCWVPMGRGGSGTAGTLSWLRRAQQSCGPGERLSGLCGLCCVFCLSVSSLLLFPLFAVLLNCPYPDPPVFCLYLSILLCTLVGGGAAAWHFCCRLLPNQNIATSTSYMYPYLKKD